MLNAFLAPLRAGLRYLSPLRPQSANDEVRGADDNLTTPPRAAKHGGYLTFRQESYAVMIDTDGATFIIDNSATCILSNDRSLFVGSLKPAGTCVQTTSGFSSPQFVGTIRLSFVTDEGQIVSYDIDDAIYDPGSGFNILGILPFSAYMAKKLGTGTEYDDETWIKSGATESYFQWEGGKHSRHFTHGQSSSHDDLP